MANPFYLPQLRPCRLATTANVASLAGGAPSPVDSVTPVVGDRILVKDQSTASQNGIYVVSVVGTGSNGTWVRSEDVPYGATNVLFAGTSVFIVEGSSNSLTRVTFTNSGVITVGSTALTFVQEAPLVRTDAASTEIIAATAFTNGTLIWSTAMNMRDFSEVSIWFNPTAIGGNTQVLLAVQWSDDGTTIPFDDDNGVQLTDFLLSTGTDGSFNPKYYIAKLDTTGVSPSLASGKIMMLSYPKKGGSFRLGVMGNNASGSFSVRAQRLA